MFASAMCYPREDSRRHMPSPLRFAAELLSSTLFTQYWNKRSYVRLIYRSTVQNSTIIQPSLR